VIKITQESYKIFTKHLCTFIIPKNKEYKEKGYNIGITKGNKLIIKYQKHKYIVEFVKENDNVYWKLTPYQNSYFTTLVCEGSFDMVLRAIEENEIIIHNIHDKFLENN